MTIMFSQLSGATQGFVFDKATAFLAVTKLMNCERHGGVHHFAVVYEGRGIYMSKTGVKCLVEQGVFPNAVAEQVTP